MLEEKKVDCWIETKNRLPKDEQMVIAIIQGNVVGGVKWFDEDMLFYHQGSDEYYMMNQVAFWQELPEPPEYVKRRDKKRTIKFRGISKYSGKFVYGYYFVKQGQDLILHQVNQCCVCQTEIFKETLGQFSGLFDKNGKEIFEGDLLSHKYYPFPVEVVFNDGKFECGDVSIFDNSIEVVGNIHENK